MSTNLLSGVGIGLRAPHLDSIRRQRPAVPWFELLADNHFADGGPTVTMVDAIREDYPLTMHCVGMNLGGVEPLNTDYLRRVRRLMHRCEPAQVSDHVCFTAAGGVDHHDLLPLPYTEESLHHLAGRISQVQDFLQCPILVENASAYLRYRHSTISEPEFLGALADEADCGLLLDINNIYVNQVNLGYPGDQFLRTLPMERVAEVHLAGFEDRGGFLVDAHNNRVADPVWTLFEQLQTLKPDLPTLIEWDNDLPDLAVLLDEADKARARLQRDAGESLRQEAA